MGFDRFWTRKTLIGLGLGQFLSLLITSTGFTSSELAKRGIFIFFKFNMKLLHKQANDYIFNFSSSLIIAHVGF